MKRCFSDGFLELISVLTALCFLCCCTTTKINTRRVPVYGEKEDQPINKPRYTSREPYFQLYNQKAEIQTASSQIPPLFAMLRFERESFNPFLEKIGIIFENPKKEYIRISISDRTLSQNLKVLAEETMDVGRQTVYWDGKGDDGAILKDGQYYIVIEGENIKPIFRKIEIELINYSPLKNLMEYTPPALSFEPEYELKEKTYYVSKPPSNFMERNSSLFLLIGALTVGMALWAILDSNDEESSSNRSPEELERNRYIGIGAGSLIFLGGMGNRPPKEKRVSNYRAKIKENISYNKGLIEQANKQKSQIERDNKKIYEHNRKIKESAIMKVRFID